MFFFQRCFLTAKSLLDDKPRFLDAQPPETSFVLNIFCVFSVMFGDAYNIHVSLQHLGSLGLEVLSNGYTTQFHQVSSEVLEDVLTC